MMLHELCKRLQLLGALAALRKTDRRFVR